MYVNRDCVVQGSNPDSFACKTRIFTIPSGMSERSFSIFRRIHVRLPLASQIAYECFPFTAVPPTDLKHFNLESSLGSAWDWQIDANRPRRVPRNSLTWVNTTLTLEELIETIGDAFNQTYSPRAPVELYCRNGASSRLELEESDDFGSGLLDLPIRGYLAAKRTSRE